MPEEEKQEHPKGDNPVVAPTEGPRDDRRRSNDRRSSQHNNKQHFSDFATASDDDFRKALEERMAENPLSKEYPYLISKAPDCFVRWRKRYATSNPKLWRRIFHVDRVLKEFFEAVPVLDAVVKMIEDDTRLQKQQKYTIIDLCSGKGYLGMFLSEILPPSKVFRIVLMDKAWPMRNAPVKPQHINWEHIYGTIGNGNESDKSGSSGEEKDECDEATKEHPKTAGGGSSSSSRSYYDTWPIPIDTSKQDLKASRQLQLIQKHYLSNPSEHPVIMLAIHLCGILSLRAIDLFNANPSVKFLALKPCCLPGMIHAKRHELFRIGSHCFEASEVCVHGKWNKDKWEKGPPRSHLKPKFQKWSSHLYQGIGFSDEAESKNESNDNDDDSVRKVHAKIVVQHGGGFQNDFLFAERTPISSGIVWNGLDEHSMSEEKWGIDQPNHDLLLDQNWIKDKLAPNWIGDNQEYYCISFFRSFFDDNDEGLSQNNHNNDNRQRRIHWRKVHLRDIHQQRQFEMGFDAHGDPEDNVRPVVILLPNKLQPWNSFNNISY